MRKPIIEPTPRRRGALADALESSSTKLKRAIRTANVLLNAEDGQVCAEDAAAYVALASRLMREVEISDRKDTTTSHKRWIREKLTSRRFASMELKEIASVLHAEVSPAMRKKVGPTWPTISVVSRERTYLRKHRIKASS